MLGHLHSLRAGLTALWLLAGCSFAPTLTLSARSSLRARRDGTTHAQLWTASAALGWSADAIYGGVERDAALEAPWVGDRASWRQPKTPCAVLAACAWEAEQYAAALARTAMIESEDP